MKYEDEFDGLLNDALREVREAEPRMGFEGRVMAGVRAKVEERRIARWKWVAVSAMVVLIVLGIGVRRGSKVDVVRKGPVPVVVPEKERVEKMQEATATVKRPKRESVSVKSVSKRVTTARVAAAARAPFPTPVPMTSEEKALMLLSKRYSNVVRRVASVDTTTGELPKLQSIEIADIRIEPLGAAETRGER
jgi:hypothetical protein